MHSQNLYCVAAAMLCTASGMPACLLASASIAAALPAAAMPPPPHALRTYCGMHEPPAHTARPDIDQIRRMTLHPAIGIAVAFRQHATAQLLSGPAKAAAQHYTRRRASAVHMGLADDSALIGQMLSILSPAHRAAPATKATDRLATPPLAYCRPRSPTSTNLDQMKVRVLCALSSLASRPVLAGGSGSMQSVTR